MRVFVTGGTGAIGAHAVPALIAAGHSVTALARSDAKAAVPRGQGAVPVSVSLFDRRGLADAFAGHDAVVNLASALPSTTAFIRKSAWTECERVRSEGSATVVDAARDADDKTFGFRPFGILLQPAHYMPDHRLSFHNIN